MAKQNQVETPIQAGVTPPQEKPTYSGIPFLSNIRQPIRKELNDRAKKRLRPITPFIKATPGFRFYKGYKKPIFKGIASKENENPSLYQMHELYQSQNAFRPLAGVTSLVVEYKNVTGAVRKASLAWICHSLADLERLGPFFLNPGRILLIEYGWNQYIDGFGNNSGGSQYTGTGGNDDYSGYNLLTYYEKTQDKVLRSEGNYDALMGVIVNYDVSMNPDGGFSCVTHITSVGDLMGNISMTQQHMVDPAILAILKSKEDKEIPISLRQFIDEYLEARIEQFLKPLGNNNIGTIYDPKRKDAFVARFENKEGGKSGIFMSWGWIEDNVLNKNVGYKTGETYFVRYDSSNSRIRTHRYLRSTDLDVCLIPMKTRKEIYFTFLQFEKQNTDDKKIYANPRNILINLDFFKGTFLDAKTIEDGIVKIFGKVNDACGNLWRFSIRTTDEKPIQSFSPSGLALSHTPSGTPTTLTSKEIVDLNYTNARVVDSSVIIDAYVFNLKSFNVKNGDTTQRATSIVRNMALVTKLSNDAALNVFYTANSKDAVVPGNENILRSLWNYTIDNKTPVDDFAIAPNSTEKQKYQVDPELARIKKELDEKKALKEDQVREGDQAGWPVELKEYLPLAFYDWHPITGLKDKIADTIDHGREMMRAAAFYEDPASAQLPSTFEAVVPLHLEVELEGISGIRAGDIFTIDNLPQLYKDKGIFQVVNIIHEVTRDTWKTKLKSSFRVQRTEKSSNPQNV